MADVIRGTMRWEFRDGGSGDGAARDHVLRALVRPDSRTVLFGPAMPADALARLATVAAQDLGTDLYIEVDEDDAATLDTLGSVGFAAHRREHHYAVPTDTAHGSCPAGLSIVSAAAVDIDRLRELDDALRQDVPGTDGWRNEPDTFADQVTGDAQFDPATYLVAVDDASGAYAGLVRVWVRTPTSRLGLIAVRRDYRRRGLAMALLAAAFGAIVARGQREVETEVDETNVESNALMQRLGARRVGGAIELVRRGS